MRRILSLVYMTTVLLSMLLVACMLLFSGPTRGEQIAMDALGHLGEPYVFGKSGPDRFDCSGLLVHCFSQHDVSLDHSAEMIGSDERFRILTDPRQLCVGDIVCFDTVDDSDPSDHVGIWLGGNRFVHASSKQGKVVVSELEGYYLDRFTFGRRILCPYF